MEAQNERFGPPFFTFDRRQEPLFSSNLDQERGPGDRGRYCMEILALIGALVLVLLNGFFVATEFSIVKVRPTRIEELQQSSPRAAAARRLITEIDDYLGACQLGITLASLGLGWLGKQAFTPLLAPLLTFVGIVDPQLTDTILAAGIFVIITYLHIVAGELAPKSLAILRPESIALAVAMPMRAFYILFYPINWFLNGTANAIVRLLGLSRDAAKEHQHSEKEIGMILTQAKSAGLLSASRSELLQKAMGLANKKVKHLMVPRNEVVFLDVNRPDDENIQRAVEQGHTRYPLCDGELDEVLGIIDVRDVLLRLRESDNPISLRKLAKPVPYFSEMMSGELLLAQLRENHIPMAVVVDEYGGAAGIVSPADVVSAVLGEIEDDDDATEVVRLPGGGYDVEGTATLEDLQHTLKVELPTEDMRTIAGFLMEQLGRMPKVGDRVTAAGYDFHVTEVAGPRVRNVRIQREWLGSSDTITRP